MHKWSITVKEFEKGKLMRKEKMLLDFPTMRECVEYVKRVDSQELDWFYNQKNPDSENFLYRGGYNYEVQYWFNQVY